MGNRDSVKDQYENIADPSQYSFADPTGRMQAAWDNIANQQNLAAGQSQGAISGAMNAVSNPQFVQQTTAAIPQFSQAISGENSALQQALNQVASTQAQEARRQVGAQFGPQPTKFQDSTSYGHKYSKAAEKARGIGMATPFANVAAQLQQNQLQGTLGMAQQAMPLFAQNVNQQMGLADMLSAREQNYAQMMANMGAQGSGMVPPELAYMESDWEKLWGGFGQMLDPLASAAGTFFGMPGLGGGGGATGGGGNAPSNNVSII